MRQHIIILLLLFCSSAFAQTDIAIGDWKAHLNFSQAIKAVETNDFIYCATRFGLFSVHKDDMSSTTYSTVSGLTGVEITEIGYDQNSDKVFVAYTDGNIDVISEASVININQIANSNVIIGSKQVHHFLFNGNTAYICTSFGIVTYNIAENKVGDSYLNLDPIGNKLEIYDAEIFNDRLYVATPIGIRSVGLADESNPLDFRFWRTDFNGGFKEIELFNDKLYVYNDSNSLYTTTGNNLTLVDTGLIVKHIENQNGKLVITKDYNVDVYDASNKKSQIITNAPAHCLIDENDEVWVCASPYGIIKFEQEKRFIKPNGPGGQNCWTADYANGEIWVASGGLDLAYNAIGTNSGIYNYSNNKWNNFNDVNTPEISKIRDIHMVKVDPKTNIKYFGSYSLGLTVFDKDNKVKVWDKASTNGALASANDNPNPNDMVRIAGMDVDADGDLWLTQQFANNQLVLKTLRDEWFAFNIGSYKRVNDVLVDDNGFVWVVKHLEGIYVYDPGNDKTSELDDRVVSLSANAGNGNLPANEVYSLTLDDDGNVWVGTADGVCVFYSPERVFDGVDFDATRPLIEEDGELAWLLEGQKIEHISIDGANQKWIATGNGVFVTNPSGTEILYNFNQSNSPLLSNNVRFVEVQGETGEVFMLTDKGIISYRAQATDGGEEHNGVTVFPNPVRPGYSGAIAIKGLVNNANVKITDISGNLVFETTAEGGQAVWDGKTLSGRSVASGVYLVFSSDISGTEAFISKVMIVR
ncbi:MAG: hypothetical protein KDC92_07895 [Bacteroidetes bacterium]|nr:hypothetical protein [Bacteroidota bacterium]